MTAGNKKMPQRKNNLPIPWAQQAREDLLTLQDKITRLEKQLHEARVQRDGWQELAERLLAQKADKDVKRVKGRSPKAA